MKKTAARYHAIERTSPKGGPFLGTCRLCGMTNLRMSAALEECANQRGLTDDEALLESLSPSPPAPDADAARREAVLAEREGILTVVRERRENAARIEREALACGSVGALFEAKCRLKAAVELEDAIRRRPAP